MNPTLIFAVAAGGAVGAVARFLTMSGVGHWFGHAMSFPVATFSVNVIGSLVLGGLLEVMALVWSPSPEIRAFLVVGMLGAFTTFSTFSMDLYALLSKGQGLTAVLYATGSVFVCLLAFWAGLSLMRQVLS